MDVDKELRESVRTGSHNSLQDVRFTPELENRIRNQVKQKGRNYNKLYISTAAVACLVVGLVAWTSPSLGLKEGFQQSVSALSEQKTKVLIEKALKPLLKAIPELSSYQVEIKESSADKIVVMLKDTSATASVAINTESGNVEIFQWSTGDETDQHPSEKVAQEKATAFLKKLLGDDSEKYKQVAVSEIKRPQNGYLVFDVKGMYVTFQQLKNGELVPFSDITVWVDGAGRVVSFGQINKEEQKMLTELREVLPELNPKSVLVNKAYITFDFRGRFLMLENTDKKGSKVMISTEGKGDTLTNYRVENERGEDTDFAWTSNAIAKEKANQFLQHVLGDDAKNYRETTESDTIYYTRYHNGIPVLEDDIFIGVNKEGRVLGYDKRVNSYDLASLPDPAKAVAKETAEAELAKNMKLRYIEHAVMKRDPETSKELEFRPILDYTPAVSFMQRGEVRSLNWYIDASTGKIQYGSGNNGMDYDRRNNHDPISLNPQQSVVIKTKEEAAQFLKEQSGVNLNNLTYDEQVDESAWNGRKQKSFHWVTNDNKWFEVVTDFATGRVIEYWIPRADTKITVSKADALKEAVRFLEKHVDSDVTEVQISQLIEPGEANPVWNGSWGFEFIKSYEGIPVLEQDPDEAYMVSVDPSTGKVDRFYNRTGMKKKVTLPDKQNVVPVQTAVEEYLRVLPLQLTYTIKGVERENLEEPMLIYIPTSDKAHANKYIHIDAVTGKAVIR
ncbi:YcdB/YcdC domain-containing protein [Brevibacillus daliensis]|uniref:YcdB/YcdC domain-containing protein n=1 Tax=Brevibacillus daliensis TaxID=2892995 RepID=UPI001E3ED370|nr:YcdB/YcdC domain-containing protein [Brevibacillus daliensis]